MAIVTLSVSKYVSIVGSAICVVIKHR